MTKRPKDHETYQRLVCKRDKVIEELSAHELVLEELYAGSDESGQFILEDINHVRYMIRTKQKLITELTASMDFIDSKVGAQLHLL